MALIFDPYSIKNLVDDKKALAAKQEHVRNRKFFCGDHWQAGDGWIGPRPKASSGGFLQVMNEIQNGFITKNVVREIVNRHITGIIGREPKWYLTPIRRLDIGEDPNPEEEAQIKLAEGILTEWWDKRNVLGSLQEAVKNLLLGERSCVRIFVPQGKLTQRPDGTSIVENEELEKVLLRYIWLNAPLPEVAGVSVNLDTMEETGLFFWKNDDATAETVEISFVDDGGLTHIQLKDQYGDEIISEAILTLAGELPMHELRREEFITEPIRKNQMGINMQLTMMNRNSILGGFLERVILNGQAPGRWEEDPDAIGTKRFVPDGELQIGGGKTTFISGQTYVDSAGVAQYVPASINYRDPVTPITFIDTKMDYYKNALEEVNQVHALIAGDATVSAVSRVQARSDFLDSLFITKPIVDHAIRWLLKAVLGFAATFSGQPNAFNLIRPMSDVKPNSGPLTPEEKTAIAMLVDKGLMSRQQALMILGTDDADAEEALISVEDQSLSFDRKLKLLEVLSKIGFLLTDEQQAWYDKELEIQVRDLKAIAAEKAAQLVAQGDANRTASVTGNPSQ